MAHPHREMSSDLFRRLELDDGVFVSHAHVLTKRC
jgi:hypothetical protein